VRDLDDRSIRLMRQLLRATIRRKPKQILMGHVSELQQGRRLWAFRSARADTLTRAQRNDRAEECRSRARDVRSSARSLPPAQSMSRPRTWVLKGCLRCRAGGAELQAQYSDAMLRRRLELELWEHQPREPSPFRWRTWESFHRRSVVADGANFSVFSKHAAR